MTIFDVTDELLSRLRVCVNLFPNRINDKMGFQFNENKHAIIYNGGNIFHHFWGGSNIEMFKKIWIECIEYDGNKNGFRLDDQMFRYGFNVPGWLKEFSFKNEKLKVDWDDFFKQFDLFMVRFV